jgi:DNA-directed RNA polymerase subunit RPC12/RpoP
MQTAKGEIMLMGDGYKPLVDILMEHQKVCGALEHSEDEKEIFCSKCGAKIIKKDNQAVIETKEFTIGLL